MVSPLHLPHRTLTEFDGNPRAWLHVLRDFLELEKRGRLLSGQTGPYDAIVDPNLAASDPANRNYLTIHEAVADLDANGYTTAAIAVRPGDIVETASVTCTTLGSLILDGFAKSGQTANADYTVAWYQGGFTITLANPDGGLGDGMVIRNMLIEPGGTKTSFFSGLGFLYCERVVVGLNEAANVTSMGCTWGYYHACQFRGTYSFGSFVFMTDCEIWPSQVRTVSFASSRLHAKGVTFYLAAESGANRVQYSLPAHTFLDFEHASDGIWGSGGGAVQIRFTGSAANGRYSIHSRAKFGYEPKITLTSPSAYEIRGDWGEIVVDGTPGASGLIAATVITADIKGPALLDLGVTAAVTLRGERVIGSITQHAVIGGDLVTLVAADRCNLHIATNNTGGGAGPRPYVIDASSDYNMLALTGGPTWTTPGSNAGSNNRILTENSDTVAAAGVTAHEAAGDPHAGYLLESLADAKGDLLAATAADTWARFAAAADGRVLFTDSTQTAGLIWRVLSALLGAPAAGATLGTVVGKVEVFDLAGASQGFIPIYDSIT